MALASPRAGGCPAIVQQIIWSANQIIGRPYIYGGGTRTSRLAVMTVRARVVRAPWRRLLTSPLDSSQFMHWGQPARVNG